MTFMPRANIIEDCYVDYNITDSDFLLINDSISIDVMILNLRYIISNYTDIDLLNDTFVPPKDIFNISYSQDPLYSTFQLSNSITAINSQLFDIPEECIGITGTIVDSFNMYRSLYNDSYKMKTFCVDLSYESAKIL